MKPTPKREWQQRLLVKIKEIIGEHEDNTNYGVRRILLALSQIEITTSYSTVYRIMKKHGLLQKVKHHPSGITREDAAAQKSENLIQRDFSASAPNRKWLSDITEIPCSDGKIYLSAVLAYRACLAKCGAIQSMSGTGRCYDNARMESIFATLKKEKLYKIKTEHYPMAHVKSIIFRYIMVYYNRQRIYTTYPGGWPPTIYRERMLSQAA
ncbi:IS3 family transposase [Paenibacillus sp. JNUCC31]|uniref:IS3 family transposase n=1 Tax=Paenibacillus sp. JNUCC-31 TaxID=2777983 RepID=UPI001E5A7E58|nr:IS3 family transposase [Paenibacillus sp. JNUCC-31]